MGADRTTWEEPGFPGGPGGQHRNKTETGVRLLHRPSGVRVAAGERRSRAQNLPHAFARLKEKLDALNAPPPPPRRPTRPTRAAKERRLQAKRLGAERKKLRRPPEE